MEAELLAVRGGGHNGPGLGSCDDGLVIDLSAMKGVRVDPATRIVSVLRLGLTGYDDGDEYRRGRIRSRVLAGLALEVETVFANLSTAGSSTPEPEANR